MPSGSAPAGIHPETESHSHAKFVKFLLGSVSATRSFEPGGSLMSFCRGYWNPRIELKVAHFHPNARIGLNIVDPAGANEFSNRG